MAASVSKRKSSIAGAKIAKSDSFFLVDINRKVIEANSSLIEPKSSIIESKPSSSLVEAKSTSAVVVTDQKALASVSSSNKRPSIVKNFTRRIYKGMHIYIK